MGEFTDLDHTGTVTEDTKLIIERYQKLKRVAVKLITTLKQKNILTNQDILDLKNEI